MWALPREAVEERPFRAALSCSINAGFSPVAGLPVYLPMFFFFLQNSKYQHL
jgi:hypothetical protein